MTDWMDRAACRGHDPELWFSNDATDRDLARAVCDRCPVRRDCGQHADSIGAEGVWGGDYRCRTRRASKSPAIENYEDTWPTHGGDPDAAADRLGVQRDSLLKTIRHALRRGEHVRGMSCQP